MHPLQFAAGSVIGTSHVRSGRNNQDAYYFKQMSYGSVAIVCDGCSGSARAEVGSQLGCRLLAQSLLQQLAHPSYTSLTSINQLLNNAQQDTLSKLGWLADTLDSYSSQVVYDYFLFTVVGMVTDGRTAWFFCLGDGLIIINETQYQIGPFANNQPPYLAYNLLDAPVFSSQELQLTVIETLDFDQLQTFLIGSDGLLDFQKVANTPMPGKLEPVLPLDQFWREDRFFNNSQTINRRLSLINKEVAQLDQEQVIINRHHGLLHDDTTLIVGRRPPSEPEESCAPSS